MVPFCPEKKKKYRCRVVVVANNRSYDVLYQVRIKKFKRTIDQLTNKFNCFFFFFISFDEFLLLVLFNN